MPSSGIARVVSGEQLAAESVQASHAVSEFDYVPLGRVTETPVRLLIPADRPEPVLAVQRPELVLGERYLGVERGDGHAAFLRLAL